MILAYIAGKYRDKEVYKIKLNINQAEIFGMDVALLGVYPVIPHMNTPLWDGLCSQEFFLEGTLELSRRCDILIAMPSWKTSEGSIGEIAEAKRMNKPVFYSIEELNQWLTNQKNELQLPTLPA